MTIRRSFLAMAMAVMATQPSNAETLKEAMALAYESNPDLLAARALLRSVDEQAPQAVAGWMPRGTYTNQKFNSKNLSRSVRDDGFLINNNEFSGSNDNRTFRGDMDLFRGFRNVNNYRAAQARIDSGRADLVGTEQQILLDAVIAYMDTLRDEAVLELNDNNVQVLTRQLEATQDRFRVGEVTRTDVAQADAALAGAVSSRIQSEAQLQASRAIYRRIIGNFPGSLQEDPPAPPLPETEEEAVEVALEQHPAVVSARYDERAARFDVAEAKGAVLPTINGFVSRNKGNSPFQVFDPTAGRFVGAANIRKGTQYGVTFTVPLYQGGAEYSAVRQQKQIRSQRMLQIASAERLAMQNVRVSWENYRAARARIGATSSQVRANEIALDGTRQESTVGARTVLDVLDAEQILLNARVDLVTAQRDEFVAAFALLEAIGRLNALSLGLPVEIYDPTGYYDKVKWKLIGWDTETGKS